MSRNNNTYAKRARDMQKKQKSDDKKARRMKRKEAARDTGESGVVDRTASGS
jgi:hypothetical protein